MKRTNRSLYSCARLFLFAATAFVLAALPGVSHAQDLFVASYQGDVSEFDATTGAELNAAFINTPGGGNIGLTSAGSTLYVENYNTGTVSAYSTATPNTSLPGFTPVTGHNTRGGIVVSNGVLYVADFDGSTIRAYNASTGAALSGFVSPAVTGPRGIVISPDGTTLYVAENISGASLGVFNLATGTQTASYNAGTITQGLALSPTGTPLYVVASGDNNVNQFTSPATGMTTSTSPFESGLNGPTCTTLYGTTLYVSELGNGGMVQAFNTSTGAAMAGFTTITNAPGLNQPYYMAVVVPEPSTWALLGVGGAALLGCRRCVRRAAKGC